MGLYDDALYATKLAPGVSRGLFHEIATDPDVMCLAVSGILLNTRFKGLGKALMTYYLTRKADQYISVIDSKLHLLARVMNEISNVISEIPSEEQ